MSGWLYLIRNRDLYKICSEKNESNLKDYDLNQTKNTQICLFLVESILLDSSIELQKI